RAPTASRYSFHIFQEGLMISSTAWCRNCSGAEFSVANTKAKRCATISNCQGPRTDFFDRRLGRYSDDWKCADEQIQSSKFGERALFRAPGIAPPRAHLACRRPSFFTAWA